MAARTDRNPLRAGLMSRKGAATPPHEPAIRIRRKHEGGRVGATLPIDMYIAFKAHVARRGVTGEQAILAAIERLLRDS
jgi:hypothetical protein